MRRRIGAVEAAATPPEGREREANDEVAPDFPADASAGLREPATRRVAS
jgi:hypothetical protein